MSKKEPRKTSQTPAAIVWSPGGGRPRGVTEALPETKGPLEEAIVNRFIDVLRGRHGKGLAPARRAPGHWPDFETTMGDRKTIGIELVEVVDPSHARKKDKQAKYLKSMLSQVEDLAPLLDGIAITIDDRYEDEWPAVGSAAARRLISHVVGHLRAEAENLARTPPGPRGRSHECKFEGVRFVIRAMRGRRIFTPAVGGDLTFSGAFVSDGLTLVRTVNDKINRAYTKYEPGDLWLLAYTAHGFDIDQRPVALTRALVAIRKHPFSEVWAFFPLVGPQQGEAVRVFP